MAYLQPPKEGSEFAILFLDPIDNENIFPCISLGIAKKHEDHWQLYLSSGTTDAGKTNYGKAAKIDEHPITFSIYFKDRVKKGWNNQTNKPDPSKDVTIKPSPFDLFIANQFESNSDLAEGFTGSFRYSDASNQILDILGSLEPGTDKYSSTLAKVWKLSCLFEDDIETDFYKKFAESVKKQDAIFLANAGKQGQKAGYKGQSEDERLTHRLTMLVILTGMETPEAIANELYPLGTDGSVLPTPMARLAELLLS